MYLIEVADARIADLQQQAERYGLVLEAKRARRAAVPVVSRPTPVQAARSALGWWLVGAGKRLAGSPR